MLSNGQTSCGPVPPELDWRADRQGLNPGQSRGSPLLGWAYVQIRQRFTTARSHCVAILGNWIEMNRLSQGATTNNPITALQDVPSGKPVTVRRFRCKALAVVSVAAMTVGVTMLSVGSASAGVRGLDLQNAGCAAQSPSTYLVLRSNNVNGWKCHGLYDMAIDFNRACRWTYGPRSSAYYLNSRDPYSWRCR